jgi:hypothetical protein
MELSLSKSSRKHGNGGRSCKIRYIQERRVHVRGDDDVEDDDEHGEEDDEDDIEDDEESLEEDSQRNGRLRRRREAAKIAMPYTV